MTSRPLLALIPGEPAGVGPELTVRALQTALPADVLVLADRQTLHHAAAALHLPLELREVTAADPSQWEAALQWAREQAARAVICPLVQERETIAGQVDPHNAAAVINALNLGSDLALAGQVQGLVTGPTHKHVLKQAGFDYSGTTEWLAQRAGTSVVMMLAHSRLRVALQTTHLPLRAVADAITAESMERTLRITHLALQRGFGIANPRLLILGLNPHAGEQGDMGDEELRVFAPVIAKLRAEGMVLSDPLPADTAFLPKKLQQWDAVIAAYHDQGLPVLKYSGFAEAVNITLGLPYPRVAVDHGTALDIAWRGVADLGSFAQAIKQCAQMAMHRRQ
ncbi:4-hydroxythreonine-4-phosphate dehydrogenase PdxA [Luteimonas sp. FXH3W]|uniref:4-hydroxythreonine-4-phosphate dehydrogenase n=1 Tax=Aquilutibacter rugosus TaxID=3115820 RepID=A0ABU7UYV0_9GAMM